MLKKLGCEVEMDAVEEVFTDMGIKAQMTYKEF